MKYILAGLLVASSSGITLRKADLPYTEEADKIDPLSRYVNDDDLVQTHSYIRKADLPATEEPEKIDPLSRYVNDDDLHLIKEQTLLQLDATKADLPYTEEADKIDPLSRYVNDDDI